MRRLPTPLAAAAFFCLGGLAVAVVACRREAGDERRPVGVLHLADSLDSAVVVSQSPPALEARSWSFAGEQAEWRRFTAADNPGLGLLDTTATAEGLQLSLSRPPQAQFPAIIAGLAVTLGDLALDDWDTVLVKARSSDRFAGITATYNLDEEGAVPNFFAFVSSPDQAPPIFNDGSVQTYAIPLRPRADAPAGTRLRDLAVLVASPGPASLEMLSITLVPRGAGFDQQAGVRSVTREGTTRTTLYAHAPATLSFPLEVGAGARLDFGLAVAPGEVVTYRVAADEEGSRKVLFEETISDPAVWQQRSVDLGSYAGRPAKLVLEAASERAGTVALWGAPIVSTGAKPEMPNVVFYVIDGGGADLMSVYGYERPTTPFLEQLAKEGVVFERAHSNSTWTQPSTVSFMTSLHHSVLGGLRRGIHSTPVPVAAVTMAERFRRGGYTTASFTSNPNAGRLIGLDRGVDVMRDVETEHHSTSSLELHEQFWKSREAYPGHPFWVHFQTTDVHEPNEPESPYAGRWVTAERREEAGQWEGSLWEAGGDLFGRTSISAFYDQALDRAGVSRHDFYTARKGLYDETMAHQDHALEQFVGELKAKGEWDNTVLVIAADHGHPAGTFARFGRGLFDPPPEPWEGALFDSYATHVPLIVVWPGRLQGGRRVKEPVSMIDVLPTLLDLAGLPQPEVLQGQSLAPLLRGEQMEVRPVVLDEFRVDEATGEMVGNLEIVDGRWGASLEIGPLAEGAPRDLGRHAIPAGGRWGAVHPWFPEVPRLLLYDLEADPFVRQSVNAANAERVKTYERQIYHLWQAHEALSQRFTAAGEAALSPEQLQQLRALGYIQ
jgi:arylsulfatase A-like enzyme